MYRACLCCMNYYIIYNIYLSIYLGEVPVGPSRARCFRPPLSADLGGRGYSSTTDQAPVPIYLSIYLSNFHSIYLSIYENYEQMSSASNALPWWATFMSAGCGACIAEVGAFTYLLEIRIESTEINLCISSLASRQSSSRLLSLSVSLRW